VLQCVAVCYVPRSMQFVLQCVVVRCSVFSSVCDESCHTSFRLQHTATLFNTLPREEYAQRSRDTHSSDCSILQHNAPHRNKFLREECAQRSRVTRNQDCFLGVDSVLQGVALYCIVLHCVVVYCSQLSGGSTTETPNRYKHQQVHQRQTALLHHHT